MAFFRQSCGVSNLSLPRPATPSPLAPDCASSVTAPSPPSSHMRIHPLSAAGISHNNSTGAYSEELWQACAGPLVSVPKTGELVWYFPQGHMEQVAASQGATPASYQKLPNSNLDAQILCRVANRTLSAELDTDDVFAQISLIPVGEVFDTSEKKDEPDAQPIKPNVRLFTKILTASDTSTHGGFSVLRRHAEECLPPLDTTQTQDPPSQDLVARDLHGKEWTFRHTYRGHPRRHLLTTGWSVFVSSKKLIAGDAVIFLRGENGELRVGIRRAKRQQAAQPSVLTSHSMHMGVMATANYAVMTRTMFSVFYKPRISLSAFLVPMGKFAAAMARSPSVGMRFKMRFETEDGSERSYSGTIVGIEDLEGSWPNSKWRSLKVNWDDMISSDRQLRVSPWEIEACVSSPPANPPPAASRSKRFRPSPLSAATSDLPAFGNGILECSPFSSKVSRVLQGQEPRNMGLGGSSWRSSAHNGMEAHHASQHVGGLQMPSPMSAFFSSFGSVPESDFKLSMSSPKLHNGLGPTIIQGSSWGLKDNWYMPTGPSSHLCSTVGKSEKLPVVHPLQGQPGSSTYSPLSPWDTSQDKKCPLSAPVPAQTLAPSVHQAQQPIAESGGGCKLFGFSLTETPPLAANKLPKTVTPSIEEENNHIKWEASSQQAHAASVEGKQDGPVELDKADHNLMKELESRSHSVRSCTKVIKKGSMVGRGVDLSKFDSYQKLLEELEAMFHMEGELTNPDKGWQVAYNDNEGDTMHVGDDPWPEFCEMVRRIYILSPEEVLNADISETKSQGIAGENTHLRERANQLHPFSE